MQAESAEQQSKPQRRQPISSTVIPRKPKNQENSKSGTVVITNRIEAKVASEDEHGTSKVNAE